MEDNAKCFIKIRNGIFEEITYKELNRRRKDNNTYKDKKFIPIQGMLLEVSIEEYKDFYRSVEKHKYYKKQERQFETISINEIEDDENFKVSRDVISDNNTDIEFEVEKKIEIEELKRALLQLSDEEYRIIKALFYDENTVRQYAERIGIPFTTIQSRKMTILKKLRKLLKK